MAFTGTTQNAGSKFTITELSGDQRQVILTGRAMPYRPYSLEGTQRNERTWLPGYSIATVTVLGPSEEPSEIRGAWKDKFIGDPTVVFSGTPPIFSSGAPVATVREAAALIDDIRRKGQLCEVTWDEQIRHGILSKFKQDWQNVHDLDWTMIFDWISQGEVADAAALTADLSGIDLQQKLLAQMSTLTNAALPPSIPTSLSFLQAIQSAFQKLNSFISNIGGATANLATLAMTPLQVARLCVSSCANVIGTVGDTIDTIDNEATISYNMAIGKQGEGAFFTSGQGFSSGSTSVFVGAGGIGTLSFNKNGLLLTNNSSGQITTTGRNLNLQRLAMSQRIQTYVYVREVRRQLLALRSIAVVGLANLSKQLQSDLVGVYTVKDGDDLRIVSRNYYNTPYQWQLIAQYNQLTTFELSPGQVLLIPRAASGEA